MTGHDVLHIESPAQVKAPSYSKSAASAARTASAAAVPSAPRRAISRVTTIRWRGLSVSVREGQRGSQKPHSMQRSAVGEIAGSGLRAFRWTSGSSLSLTPGFRMPAGSRSLLIRFINA